MLLMLRVIPDPDWNSTEDNIINVLEYAIEQSNKLPPLMDVNIVRDRVALLRKTLVAFRKWETIPGVVVVDNGDYDTTSEYLNHKENYLERYFHLNQGLPMLPIYEELFELWDFDPYPNGLPGSHDDPVSLDD